MRLKQYKSRILQNKVYLRGNIYGGHMGHFWRYKNTIIQNFLAFFESLEHSVYVLSNVDHMQLLLNLGSNECKNWSKCQFKHVFFILNRPGWFQIAVNSSMKLGIWSYQSVSDWYSRWGELLGSLQQQGQHWNCKRCLRKQSMKAWDSSVAWLLTLRMEELGAIRQTLVGSGNFKIGQNNESQCVNPFMGTLTADGEHTDFVGH